MHNNHHNNNHNSSNNNHNYLHDHDKYKLRNSKLDLYYSLFPTHIQLL